MTTSNDSGSREWILRSTAFALGACLWMVFWLGLLFGGARLLPSWLLIVIALLWGLFAVVLRRDPLTGRPEQAHREANDRGRDVPHRLVGAVVTLGVAGITWLLWLWVFRSDEWLFIAIILTFLGLGLLVNAVRASAWKRWWKGLVVIALCAIAFVVGLVAISQGAPMLAALLMAGAVLAFPMGLSWLSGDVLHWMQRRPPSSRFLVLLLVLGGAFALTGIVLLAAADVPILYVVLIPIVLFLIVGAITSNTSADITIVIIAVALAWSLAPRGVQQDEWVTPESGESVMVALGDSYMSGEGADRFFEGTNTRGVNECRRAPTAYAALVTQVEDERIPDDVVFLACSGAKTGHVYLEPQYTGEPIRIDGAGPGLDQLGQWRWVQESVDLDPRLVIVSIGGNDALFGEVGRICALPVDCSRIGERWLANLETDVARNVGTAFEAIRDAFPSVPVVAVPYPMPLRDRPCSWSVLSRNEHRFIFGFVRELNGVIRGVAANEGLYYLDNMEPALEARNLRICDRGPGSVGVNLFALNPVGGRLSDTLNPRQWFHNSLHPNERGHEATRDTLAAWIQDQPDLQPAAPDDTPTPISVASIEQIMGDPEYRHCGRAGSGLSHCEETSWAWAFAELLPALLFAVVLVLLLVAGSWLLWLRILRDRRLGTLLDQFRDLLPGSAALNRPGLGSVLARSSRGTNT